MPGLLELLDQLGQRAGQGIDQYGSGILGLLKFPGQYVQDYQPGQMVQTGTPEWAAQMAMHMIGAPGVPSGAVGSAAAPLGRVIEGRVIPERTFEGAKPLDNSFARYPNDRPNPESLLIMGVNRDAGTLQGYKYYVPYDAPLREPRIGGRYRP